MPVVIAGLVTITLLALVTAIAGAMLQVFWNGEPLGKAGGIIGAVGGFAFAASFLLELMWTLWHQPKASAHASPATEWQTLE